MSDPLRLRLRAGWFPAGDPVRVALTRLSDGAFKLFVWLCLRAEPSTGRVSASHAELARALGKSRRSIVTYLQELEAQGVCRLRPAANQHQPGMIEIRDAFWPYWKTQPETPSGEESDYVEQAARRFALLPAVAGSFTPEDRHLAARLQRRGVPLLQLERAFLLGSARKLVSWLNGRSDPPIRSLSYFLPLVEEVASQPVSDDYWAYLKQRLPQLQRKREQQLAACANFAQPNPRKGETR